MNEARAARPAGLFEPSVRLLLLLTVATIAVWLIGGTTPNLAAEALVTEAEATAAYARRDYATAAEEGLRRIDMEGAVAADLPFRTLISDALARTGREGAALAVSSAGLTFAVEVAGEDAPEANMMRNNLAWRLVSLTEPSEDDLHHARALARRALAGAPDDPFILGTLGTAELLLGDLEDARQHLERSTALHTQPDARATDRSILAVVLARQGELDAAREALAQALQDGTPDETWRTRAQAALGQTPSEESPEFPSTTRSRPANEPAYDIEVPSL